MFLVFSLVLFVSVFLCVIDLFCLQVCVCFWWFALVSNVFGWFGFGLGLVFLAEDWGGSGGGGERWCVFARCAHLTMVEVLF